MWKLVALAALVFCGWAYPSGAQRSYKPNSVLTAGSWYKLGVSREGIYKIDIPFLNSLGINSSVINSSSIRLFGNGGAMLAESNAVPRSDDLEENALLVVDGGDGQLNGSDYALFYAPGPNAWQKDSLNKSFIHRLNIYSDTSYYFLAIGGTGRRVPLFTNTASPNMSVTSFHERIFHELDSVNLLSSGKEWFGEEFTDAPGKSLSRTFTVSIPGLVPTEPLTFITNAIARSIGTASRFDISINNQPVLQLGVPAAGSGIYDLFAQQAQQNITTTVSQENLFLTYNYVPGGFNAQGWLNWFEIHARRNISIPQLGQLLFRDWNSVGNNIAEFIISNAGNSTQVWEITDPLFPKMLQGIFANNQFRFVNDCSRLREYVAFNPSGAMTPHPVGRISNQDLHDSQPADYLIISNESLVSQAERLAAFHRQKNNLKVFVTTTQRIFNEFSSGTPDPVAVRDFAKMYFDKATANPAQRPKYLLLFGDASFDYKNRVSMNTNLVPAYQTFNSLDPLNTYTSDDFFGYLDDNEDINSGLVTNLLDVGIGRVPAKNIDEAKNFVDKVEAYHSRGSLGQWRTNISFVADDEDLNLHLNDAEIISATSETANPIFNIQKIYLDAYRQESGPGGARYPLANEAINNRIFNGTLIWNYSGHGGARRLAEEVVLDQQTVNGWSNGTRLPLIITATCDFAPYDNPFIASLGENLLLRPVTGSIALMTTTRLVFSFSNRLMNDSYMKFALEPDPSGKYKTLGEAIMVTKNHIYQSSGDIANNRKFTLLGDPALRLGFPNFRISTTMMNNVPASQTDTLSAGEKVTIEGEIRDLGGGLMTGFSGVVYPVVYDKPVEHNTLGNDPTSISVNFRQSSTTIFKGKATVSNGKFRFEFKVPKDIDNRIGNGRISYYAENGDIDGSDYFKDFIIGGIANITDADKEGPVIRAWLNDERFVNGSITNENPVLLLRLSDSSGINTAGTGIGHDIVAIIDNDNARVHILNDYYEADLDNYKTGMVRFQLPRFDPGQHSIKIKAWDALNNSTEILLEFSVVSDDELSIDHVLNYPNPFTTSTQFWFEHNKPNQDLFVQILIYSLSGKLIRRIEKTINTPGNRSNDLEWNGKDEFGDKVGRGVYFYKIRIQTPGSKPRSVIEKLVIL